MTSNPKQKKEKSSPTPPEMWLDEYGDYLYRYALSRMKSTAIAEDLVQETFISALKAWDKFEGRSAVKSWLITILRNKLIDHVRKHKREILTEDEIETGFMEPNCFNKAGIWNQFVSNWAKDPDALLENKRFLKALKICLDELPKKARSVFVLRTVEGYDSDEICKDLEISPSNYWVLMHRARLALRGCIENKWGTPVTD